MDPNLLIMISAFIGVIALVFGVGFALQGKSDSTLEARLAAFTGTAQPSKSDITVEVIAPW